MSRTTNPPDVSRYPVRPERVVDAAVEVSAPIVDQLYAVTLVSELRDALARVAVGFSLDTEDRLLIVKATAFLKSAQ